MATNPYFDSSFNATNEDQALAEGLIIESIQAYGQDYYYLPRTLENFDSFFGEDSSSSFRDAVLIEAYLLNTEYFLGNGSFLEKFGLVDYDNNKISISIKRFEEVVTSQFPEIKRPREGDVFMFPKSVDSYNRFMEITYVEKERPFHQLGKPYLYTCTVKNFEYNDEKVLTGIPSVDDYETELASSLAISLSNGSGSFMAGEEVSQTNGFSASVVMMENSNSVIVVGIKGELSSDIPLIGEISGTQRTPSTKDVDIKSLNMIHDNEVIEDSNVVINNSNSLFN